MKKFLQKKLKNEKGMTLIELLAVIVIIAIIAAIAIPAIGNIIENSRYGAAKSDFQNAIAAANVYIAEEGTDPATIADLDEYLEDQGSLADTVAFDRNASDELTIEGQFEVSGDSFTLSAKTNSELSDMTSAEFRDDVTAVTAPTTPAEG